MIEFIKRISAQIGWGVLIGALLFVVMLNWETVLNGTFTDDRVAAHSLHRMTDRGIYNDRGVLDVG
jgi:hypothetical protein